MSKLQGLPSSIIDDTYGVIRKTFKKMKAYKPKEVPKSVIRLLNDYVTFDILMTRDVEKLNILILTLGIEDSTYFLQEVLGYDDFVYEHWLEYAKDPMSSFNRPSDVPDTGVAVELLHHTPIDIIDLAIGTCWDKPSDRETNFARMDRVVNKFKHASTSEHATFNFYITELSRAILQELVRHRHANYSVMSTRYTLGELKLARPFFWVTKGKEHYDMVAASKYIMLTDVEELDQVIVKALENVRLLVNTGMDNDLTKLAIPEAYKTKLSFTVNVRSLKNLIQLRTNKSAHWAIRDLAYKLYREIPSEYKFLFERELYVGEEKDGEL